MRHGELAEPEGVKPFQYFYPTYNWQRKRERTYAICTADSRSSTTRLVTEDGECFEFPFGDAGYDALARTVASHRLTAFTELVEGTHRFPYLRAALHDAHASVYASERKGPVGISIRRGRARGSIVTPASWHKEEADNALWLHALRDVAERTGIGAYDTPAAMGTAILYRMWKQQGLPHVLALPHDMMGEMLHYTCGGRVDHEGIGRTYPLLYESDIRQAYPTVVAQGLPWGSHVYTDHDPTAACRETNAPAYGHWILYITSDIEHSPIPLREWGKESAATAWNLPIGRYEYSGWLEEIEALRHTGCAIAVWTYGWVWHNLGNDLKPWVDEMAEYRAGYAHERNQLAEDIIKLATNGTLGRWSMRPERLTLVSTEQAAPGDTMVVLPEWAFFDGSKEPIDVLLHRDTQEKATPIHWGSYVRMKVRMEIYARSQAGRAAGATVVMENFDAIVSTAPIDTSDSPYKWKVYTHTEAHLPYARAIESWVETPDGRQVYVRHLPGIPRTLREAQHERSMAP